MKINKKTDSVKSVPFADVPVGTVYTHSQSDPMAYYMKLSASTSYQGVCLVTGALVYTDSGDVCFLPNVALEVN